MFLMNIKTPVGTSIQATNWTFKKAEAYLKSQPEIQDHYTTIGNYEQNNVVNAGTIYVTLKDPKHRKLGQREIMDRTRAELPKALAGHESLRAGLVADGFQRIARFSGGVRARRAGLGEAHDRCRNHHRQAQSHGTCRGYQQRLPGQECPRCSYPDRAKRLARGVSVTTIGQRSQHPGRAADFQREHRVPQRRPSLLHPRPSANRISTTTPKDLDESD